MFYKSSLDLDKIHIATYGKAKAILQLMEHFACVSPFEEIYLFDQVKDLKLLLPYLPKNYLYRQDTPLGNGMLSNIKKCGTQSDIVPYFEKLKQQSANHVLLVMPTKLPNLPRYQSGGAFNVVLHKGLSAIVEFVGRGFDAHELTNGVALHELYVLGWDDILFCSDGNKLNQFKSKQVSEGDYARSRSVRSQYLTDSQFDPINFNPFLPQHYAPIPTGVKTKILNNILFPLFTKMQFHTLPQDQYWVCGNMTLENDIVPFEFSSIERLMKKTDLKSSSFILEK